MDVKELLIKLDKEKKMLKNIVASDKEKIDMKIYKN